MAISVSKYFEDFTKLLRLSGEDNNKITTRYHCITRRINKDFWGIDSDIRNSFYVGSHGRGTEIYTSDIDIVVVLPYEKYAQYNNYSYNGQSSLLQEVKNSIKNTYSNTGIGGDGQVVVVQFSDEIKFEVVPAFLNKDGSYTYPDSNNGGSWRTMDPKKEIAAVNEFNEETNHNYKRLCKMVREWNKYNYVGMTGILIDTTVFRFLQNWDYKEKSYLYYDWMSRDYFKYLYENADKDYWVVPGSGWHVVKKKSFKLAAKNAYDTILEALDAEKKEYEYTYNVKWREVYGTKFGY